MIQAAFLFAGLAVGLFLVSCSRPPRQACHRAEPFCRDGVRP
jgi:hypothetical protein